MNAPKHPRELIGWSVDNGDIVLRVRFDHQIHDLAELEAISFIRAMHILVERRVDDLFQLLIDALKRLRDYLVKNGW